MDGESKLWPLRLVLWSHYPPGYLALKLVSIGTLGPNYFYLGTWTLRAMLQRYHSIPQHQRPKIHGCLGILIHYAEGNVVRLADEGRNA